MRTDLYTYIYSATAPAAAAATAEISAKVLEIDEGAEVTRIKIVLPNGKSLTLKCNLTHRVADIMAHVRAYVWVSAYAFAACTQHT